MRVLLLLLVAHVQFASSIFHHAGRMQTAQQVLQDCLLESGLELPHIQSHARHIPLDTRALIDMHFSPLGNAPLDAAAIGAAEAACGQPAGSAHITSTRSFYVACSAAATLPALAAHPLSPDHRMSSFEAAAVCASAAARPAIAPVQLVATIATEKGLEHITDALAAAFSQLPALSGVELQQESASVLSFTCPAAAAPLLSHWLLHRAVVRHLQRRPHFRLMNANAAWIVQSGTPKRTSVWDRGLRGAGQVVHVGDTGVDWNLCFFQPPGSNSSASLPPPYFKQKISRSNPLKCGDGSRDLVPSTSHKFAAYVTIQGGDQTDEKGGHGTHVCGTVAGGAPNTSSLAQHNGMAPAAQLSFTDLQGEGGGLSVPYDLCNNYFPCAYASGARISSNSWGGSNSGYDAFAYSLDQFAVDHDDMLVVFAAGNSGPGAFTAGTPSLAKNTLAVGATVNGPTNLKIGKSNGLNFSSSDPPSSFVAAAALAAFAENPSCIGGGSFAHSVALPSLPLACDPLCSPGETPFNNRVVVLRRGLCTFQSKAARAVACGAAAVVIINTDDTLLTMSGDGESPSVGSVPVFLIKKSDGAALSPLYSAAYPFPTSAPDADPIAFFSSMGPTYDNRIKPDIVAPGHAVLSAKAMNADQCTRDPTHHTPCSACSGNDFCHADPSVTPMSGTSMATPVVSGAAALLRQYFLQGVYPPGTVLDHPPGGFSPSSALLRAMLLASAHSVLPMTAARDGDPFSRRNIPSLAQGHGIIQLDSVLAFNDASPLLRLFVVDRKSITSSEAPHVYAFGATDAMAPQVTLSWTDPPMRTTQLSLSTLVNDLHLELHSPSGRVVAGNFAQYGPSSSYSDIL
jgi:subtilisin family serine protease